MSWLPPRPYPQLTAVLISLEGMTVGRMKSRNWSRVLPRSHASATEAGTAVQLEIMFALHHLCYRKVGGSRYNVATISSFLSIPERRTVRNPQEKAGYRERGVSDDIFSAFSSDHNFGHVPRQRLHSNSPLAVLDGRLLPRRENWLRCWYAAMGPGIYGSPEGTRDSW